jgi:hypothetical protein
MSRKVAELITTTALDFTGATVTNSQVLTFPTTATNIVGDNTTNTLTNKTISDISNDVAANALRNGATITALSETGPTNGQVLSYDGTEVAWIDLPSSPISTHKIVTQDDSDVDIFTFTTEANTSYLFRAKIIARTVSETANTVGYVLTAVFYNDGTGAVAVSVNDVLQFPPNATYTAEFLASTNDVVLRINGSATEDVDWVAIVEVIPSTQ